MAADNEAPKKPTKITVKDFADEQKPEEQLDLSAKEQALDDATIEETLAEEHENTEDVEVAEEDQPELSSEQTGVDEPESVQDREESATELDEVKPEEVKQADAVENDATAADETQPEILEALEQPKNSVSDDHELEKAVDDIVLEESDDVIELDDASKAAGGESASGIGARIKQAFLWWWRFTLLRNATFAAVVFGMIAVALIPNTRYWLLNTAGVRVSSSLQVLDSETSLPLKNMTVLLQEKEQRTDEDGKVRFEGIKLGDSALKITRRGYAEIEEQIVLGWGSNPLEPRYVEATGIQYSFKLKDWLSGDVITDASIEAGEYSAQADDAGDVTLTLGEDDTSDMQLTVYAAGYRDEVFEVDDLKTDQVKTVTMVNDRRHVFVSNRDSKYDLYSIDLDGKNEQLLLSATGNERVVPTLLHHPSQPQVALVSSREGNTNDDGYVFDGLFIVDVNSGDFYKVARSERITLVGWSDEYLVYWSVVEGTSRGNPERSKLVSYNINSGERIELAAANYFNDVELVDSTVYYAVAGFAVPESYARLFEVGVNGEQKVQIIDKQVYTIFRPEYKTLIYEAFEQEWFEQKLPSTPEQIDRRTSTPENYNFVNNSSNEMSALVRVRDGQGVLEYIDTNNTDGQAIEVITESGLSEPLYWVGDDAVVYRVVKVGETADYIVSLQKRAESQDSERTSKISNITVQSYGGYR